MCQVGGHSKVRKITVPSAAGNRAKSACAITNCIIWGSTCQVRRLIGLLIVLLPTHKRTVKKIGFGAMFCTGLSLEQLTATNVSQEVSSLTSCSRCSWSWLTQCGALCWSLLGGSVGLIKSSREYAVICEISFDLIFTGATNYAFCSWRSYL